MDLQEIKPDSKVDKIKTRTADIVKESADKNNIVVIVSTETLDTHKTMLNPEGCDLSSYKRNPVVLYNHDTNLVLANGANIRLQDGKIIAEIPYDNFDNEDEQVVKITRKIRKGIIRACSVGFTYHPNDTELRTNDEGKDYIYIRKWTLLEISLLPVGSNADALIVKRNANNTNNMNEELNERLDNFESMLTSIVGMLEELKDANSASDTEEEERKMEEKEEDRAAHDEPEEDESDEVQERSFDTEMITKLIQESISKNLGKS